MAPTLSARVHPIGTWWEPWIVAMLGICMIFHIVGKARTGNDPRIPTPNVGVYRVGNRPGRVQEDDEINPMIPCPIPEQVQ